MPRRSRRPRVPLEHRLPNPSPLFVGREDEIAWLRSALERGPVAVVRGPGGIGKTELVLATMAEAYPGQRDRTLYVPIPAGEAPDQVRITIAHLLATVAGEQDVVDIAGLRGDPDELTALAIDLAETGPFWVVIDDLQHTDPSEMGEMLLRLSSYARESRWIVTTRAQDELPRLEGQILDIDRMGVTSLAEIARALSPDRSSEAVQTAIDAAAGSPWLLKQYLAAGADSVALTRAGVLESMSAEARELLHTLAMLETPFERGPLAELTALPADDELDALSARGLLLRRSTGLSVHDQVRDFLFPPGTPEDDSETERRAQIAQALSRRDEPEAVLEALRLHRQSGRIDDVVALLDLRGHELMGLGFAPRVWAVVGRLTDRRLGLWQLRCAAELGNATVLAAVRPPRLTSDEDQLAWAATQYLVGERELARELAVTVAEDTQDETLRSDAICLAARCLLRLGRPQEACRELDAAGSRSFALDALRLLTEACRDVEETGARAAALLERAREGADPEALLDLATAFYRAGDRPRAEEVVDRVLATPRGGRASLLVARRALLLRARIRIDAGALAEAETLLELVRPYARGSSGLRPLILELEGARRLAVGELEHLEAVIERGVELARQTDAGVLRRLTTLSDELRRRRGRSSSASDRVTSEPGSPWEPRDETRLRASLEAARLRLGSGDLADTIDVLRQIRREASQSGLALLEADALSLLADGLMVGMYVEELGEAVEALNTLADFLGSPRLRHHAAFYGGHGEVAVLERLACEMQVAPVVARRARALLGHRAELGTIDEMTLAAAQTEWVERRIIGVARVRAEKWVPAWGIDTTQSTVWLPDGRTVDLRKKPLLFRILTSLVERGGAASKEQLINEAWGESDYHPIRHDPKLHASVRALRKAIEDDPSAPTRLLTTEEGYELGGAIRRVDRRPDGAPGRG